MDLVATSPTNMNHPLSKHANPYSTPQSSTAPVSYPSPFRSHPQPSSSPSHSSMQSSHTPHPANSNLSGQVFFPQDSTTPRSQAQSSSRPLSRGTISTGRQLPSQNFRDDQEFENAYVSFIFYCNPTIPSDVETTDLRRNFSNPPRSDGKSFSTKILYELLRKFDTKEIKTWTELALELGVEKPAVEKGQSSQKVQQYSVRLKRWLRASHIDAFFDYMMGKSHSYARELPTSHDPFPEVRDGVCRDDDLALRALKPEFRPKRGRRRVDDIDDFEPMSAIEPKRPHLDTSIGSYPHSAYPASAHPDDIDRFSHDQWMTPSSLAPSSAVRQSSGNYRFLVNETPTTPNPMSAMTPLSAHPDSAIGDEPLSALSQSQRMRMRRRHGTAVSSAWPSNNTTPNGKLRGRPPTNRSVKDGPFVTFPANPKAKDGPSHNMSRSISGPLSARELTPPATAGSMRLDSPFRIPQMPTPISTTSTKPISTTTPTGPSPSNNRPGLSLQVPQHVGNPVRLVTPTVIVNGSEEEDRFKRPGSSSGRTPQRTPQLSTRPSLTNENLKRALVADLVRADVTGRTKSLRGTEAKDLADAMLASARARTTTSASPCLDATQSAADDAFRLTTAAWLGITLPSTAPGSTSSPWANSLPSASNVKKIHVRRFRVSGDGYESPIDEDDEILDDETHVKQTFDIEWDLSLGSLVGKFTVKGLVVGDHVTATPSTAATTRERDGLEDLVNEEEMRKRYVEMKSELDKAKEELRSVRDDVLRAALGS